MYLFDGSWSRLFNVTFFIFSSFMIGDGLSHISTCSCLATLFLSYSNGMKSTNIHLDDSASSLPSLIEMVFFFSYIRICKNRIEYDSRIMVPGCILHLSVKKI